MVKKPSEEQQRKALNEIRDKFKDKKEIFLPSFPFNDTLLLRYLRARNFDVKKASSMLEATLQWRLEFAVDELYEGKWDDTLAKENETGKMYARGYDNTGNVCLYMKPRFENTNNHDGNLKHLVYNMERAICCNDNDKNSSITESITSVFNSMTIDTTKSPEGKITLLIDYEGFSLFNAPPFKTSKAVLGILQNHYPERLFRAYLLNPPMIFSGFWTMISPFIDPITKDKIRFVRGNKEKMIESLSKDISADVIENSIGGNDKREFDSKIYLQKGKFHMDYYSILESLKESKS